MRDAAWLQQPLPSAAAASAATSTGAASSASGDRDRERTGVAIGVGGLGSMHDVAASALALRDRGYSRVSAYFLPRILPNMTAGQVALHLRLTGPVSAPSGACATGAQAIGEALRTIQFGDADVMLAGGADASLDPLSVAGFVRCRALSSSSASSASRPFHARRDGFVMGEGAAVLVLEELEHAVRRRAPRIYAEVCGYASRADPSHLTSPSDAGDAAYRVMAAALDDARVRPCDVDYLNAHATSTPAGDRAELRAVRRLFGGCDALPALAATQASKHTPAASAPSVHAPPVEHQSRQQQRSQQPALAISSTKGATGHLLGAAGALESAFCVLAIRDGVVPPTLHLDEVDAEFAAAAAIDPQHDSSSPSFSPSSLNLVPLRKQTRRVDVAMNNSFGFGGVNACLVFRKPPPTV
jgi:3-oxoacyl-[acyl-carrier-protein] synthase II